MLNLPEHIPLEYSRSPSREQVAAIAVESHALHRMQMPGDLSPGGGVVVDEEDTCARAAGYQGLAIRADRQRGDRLRQLEGSNDGRGSVVQADDTALETGA